MAGLVVDSDEHRLIRESTAKIARKFGSEYFLERARAGSHVDELWNELGDAGSAGRAPARGVRRRGRRHGRSRRRRRRAGGARNAHADLGHLAGDLRQHPRAPRIGGDEAGVAARARRRSPQDGFRPDRAGCRLQQPQRVDHCAPRRRRAGRSPGRSTTSPPSTRPRRCSSSPATPKRHAGEDAPCRCSSSRPTPRDWPTSRWKPSIVSPDKQFTLFLDDVEVGPKTRSSAKPARAYGRCSRA